MWIAFLSQIGGFAAVVAVLGWVGRSVAIHWLDKNLKSHEHQLAATYAQEMERLRHQLQVAATEHEIRFRSIHEKQAEVIAEIYGLLRELHRAAASYVAMFEQGD